MCLGCGLDSDKGGRGRGRVLNIPSFCTPFLVLAHTEQVQYLFFVVSSWHIVFSQQPLDRLT